MCLERYIVEQCAPTLASIKTGALFGVIDPDTEELLRQAEHWRERLAGKGLALRVLRCRPGRALIYLGRLSQLERDLASSGAAELLERCGYASHGCDEALETLRRRVLSSESFPHEIGLFLGYPRKKQQALRRMAGLRRRGRGRAELPPVQEMQRALQTAL